MSQPTSLVNRSINSLASLLDSVVRLAAVLRMEQIWSITHSVGESLFKKKTKLTTS